VENFTVEEIVEQLKLMKNKKGADTRGIVAEMLKKSSHEFQTSSTICFLVHSANPIVETSKSER